MSNLSMYVVEAGRVGPDPEWFELRRGPRRDWAIEQMTTVATSAAWQLYAPDGTHRLRVREVS